MINIENVSFKYKNSDYILKNINFSVNDGEVIAIVGKNGSGKSTLGRLIAGITKLKDVLEAYEIIAKNIGAMKNGEVDYERVSLKIVNDIKSESVKGITFDRK